MWFLFDSNTTFHTAQAAAYFSNPWYNGLRFENNGGWNSGLAPKGLI